jgi:hypothetical protein
MQKYDLEDQGTGVTQHDESWFVCHAGHSKGNARTVEARCKSIWCCYAHPGSWYHIGCHCYCRETLDVAAANSLMSVCERELLAAQPVQMALGSVNL